MNLTAHYFASRTVKYLVIAEGPRPIGERIPVSGKVEARRIAAESGATPWNF